MEKIYGTKLSSQIFNRLFTTQTCVRCILRIFRIHNHTFYHKNNSYKDLLDKVSSQLNLSKSLNENYDPKYFAHKHDHQEGSHANCPACLGILQHIDKKHYVDDIIARIQKEKFEFKSFQLSANVPLSSSIRSAQLLYYAQKDIELSKQYNTEMQQMSSFFNAENKMTDLRAVVKWLLSPEIARALNAQAKSDDDFSIKIRYHNKTLDQQEFNSLNLSNNKNIRTKKPKEAKDNSKKNEESMMYELNAFNLEKILSLPLNVLMSAKTKKDGSYLPPDPFSGHIKFDVSCSYTPVYLTGNYLKFSREISHSPMEVDGKMKCATSVQNELEKMLKPYFEPKEFLFQSGGREDIDVRMLGDGRPFLMQMINCRKAHHIKDLSLEEVEPKCINSLVQAKNLSFGNEKSSELLKESESDHLKGYACVVVSDKEITQQDVDKINNVQDLAIKQKTPIRVSHRRAQTVREKVIYKLRAKQIDSNHLVLFVLSSAGTYIKEFVHGDLNRTEPNVGSLLGMDADIKQLDVLKLYDKYDETVVEDFVKFCDTYKYDA